MRWLLSLFFLSRFSYGEIVTIPDLTLSRAEVTALENNPRVNSVRELYAKAGQGHWDSISKWLPQLTAMSDMYVSDQPQVFTDAKSAFLTQLSLTQSLFSSNVFYGIQISSLIKEQLRLLLDAAIIDVLFDVRSAYYRVILDSEIIRAAKGKIDLLESLSKRMEDRYRIGTSILYGVNQSKVAIANATSTYYEALKNRKIDIDRLACILGFNPGEVEISFGQEGLPVEEIPELKEALEKVESVFTNNETVWDDPIYRSGYPETEIGKVRGLYSPADIRRWEELALHYQPNVKVYANYVRIAQKEVSKVKGEYLPTAAVNINYGGNPTTLLFVPATRFGNQQFQWGFGLQFNWTLFDGLGREHRIKEARYAQKSKEFDYRQTVQKTFADVRKQIFNMEESAAILVTARANVKLAEQTVALAEDQWEIGYATVFDYQITVDGLIQAINIKNKARYDLLYAYYGLRHAVGIDSEYQ